MLEQKEKRVGTIICCKEPALKFTKLICSWWLDMGLVFFPLFVCLYVCSFKDHGKVVAHNDNVAGKKRAIPRGKNWLILSARATNQNTRYVSFTVPPREGKGEGTQTITKLLSCEGSFGLACTSVSYLFLSLSLIKRDLVSSFQLANIRFSRFCKKKIQ